MRPSLVTAASISVMRFGSRARGDEMFDPVLDPLHRPPGDLRRDRGQHHVGKHRELDAEAAAAIRRDAQAHLGAGHPQRLRHHRMGRERPLEIRGDVVALVVRMIFGDDDVALHRREGEPGVVDGERDPGIGAGEGVGGIAVGEFADRDFVGLALRVEQRRRFVAGGDGIDHGGQRLVVDLDQLRGVLRHVPACRPRPAPPPRRHSAPARRRATTGALAL